MVPCLQIYPALPFLRDRHEFPGGRFRVDSTRKKRLVQGRHSAFLALARLDFAARSADLGAKILSSSRDT